jgi:hypothetical protein
MSGTPRNIPTGRLPRRVLVTVLRTVLIATLVSVAGYAFGRYVGRALL